MSSPNDWMLYVILNRAGRELQEQRIYTSLIVRTCPYGKSHDGGQITSTVNVVIRILSKHLRD